MHAAEHIPSISSCQGRRDAGAEQSHAEEPQQQAGAGVFNLDPRVWDDAAAGSGGGSDDGSSGDEGYM